MPSAFVLDYLRDGSADLDEMCRAALHLGYTRERVIEALGGHRRHQRA